MMILKKLNIGCRFDLKPEKEGWVNADILPLDKRVVKADLEKRLPFKDNEFDFVYLRHVFEHLQKPKFVLKELNRIMKPNAMLEIITPHSSHHKSMTALDHFQAMDYGTLNEFESPMNKRHNYDFTFKIIEKEFTVVNASKFSGLAKIIANKYPLFWERWIASILQIYEIRYLLQKKVD